MKRFTSKKRLLALIVGMFAWIGVNAETWSVTFNSDKSVATLTCTEVNGTNSSTSFVFPGGGSTSDIKNAGTLKFKTAEGIEITSLGALDAIKPFEATTVDFGEAVFHETPDGVINYTAWDPNRTPHEYQTSVTKTKNCMTFEIFAKCSNATLANVKTLCAGLFKSNSAMTTTFTIPSSVEVIATLAVENTPISNITIPATVKYIQAQAFQNAAIKALIDVTVKGYTAAANAAFDKQTTVGQTDADYPDYATLHFPEGAEDYFTNTQHKLTVAISLNKGKFQAWLNDHYAAASTCSNPNGWKEFMNAGGGKPEKPAKEVVLRTYSDDVACIVPIGFRAYLVTGVTEATVGGKKQYTVKLQQIFAIPANTGVILYGEVKDKNTGYVLTKIPYWSSDHTSADYVAPYNRKSGIIVDPDNIQVTVKNYMVPTVTSTKIYPYYKDMTDSKWATIWSANPPSSMAQYYTGTDVTDRNFILTHLKGTSLADAQTDDYVGLFRVKPGVNCGPNKAYLSLPVGLFNNPEGAEALVVKPETPADMRFRYEVWNDAVSTGNWGQRGEIGVLQAKFAGDDIFIDEFGGIATGIQEVNGQVENTNDYYTLSGQRVSNPKQGIYVKNGKKVIIRNY